MKIPVLPITNPKKEFSMTNNKEALSHPGKNPSGSKPDDTLSTQRRAREKSEEKNYAKMDKRKEARIEHRNGSTPSDRS
jgi:hypothetical protein